MIYVGIDIAKQKHFASAMSADGEVLINPFSFTNDHNGFQSILSKLSTFEKESLVIGMESTAHYGEKHSIPLEFDLSSSFLYSQG
jgi:transposase